MKHVVCLLLLCLFVFGVFTACNTNRTYVPLSDETFRTDLDVKADANEKIVSAVGLKVGPWPGVTYQAVLKKLGCTITDSPTRQYTYDDRFNYRYEENDVIYYVDVYPSRFEILVQYPGCMNSLQVKCETELYYGRGLSVSDITVLTMK